MEMKLKTVIDILKQENNPDRPPVVGMEQPSDEMRVGLRLGVEHCIDLLTKISMAGETRTYFEFGKGEDNLVLLIPYDRQEDFLSYLEIAFSEVRDPENIGDYLSFSGILSNEYPRKESVKH